MTTHAAAVTPAAAAKSTPAAAPPAQSSNSGSTSNDDISQYLSAHNTVRAQHGAVALTWNDEAASKAQQWANGCVFQHSGGSLGPYGGGFRVPRHNAYI